MTKTERNERILDARRAGRRINEIAAQFKLNERTVRRVCASHEVRVERPDNRDRNNRIVALREDGETFEAIAELVGLDRAEVRKVYYRETGREQPKREVGGTDVVPYVPDDIDLSYLPEKLTLHIRNGRSGYSPVHVHMVLAGLRAGLNMAQALREAGVSERLWAGWCDRDPELIEITLKAAEISSHNMVLQATAIADEVQEDRDAVAKAKLRIDTRLKVASLLNRQFYGDQLPQAIGNSFNLSFEIPGMPPIEVNADE